MIVAKTLAEFAQAYSNLENKADIGFVPTMGALHEGHISLVKESAKRCSHTVVSIFVNPTQFNNKQDLETYPRTLEADCKLLEECAVDIVFAPRVIDIYPQEDTRVFDLGGLDNYGEGPRRPGHFNGVAQVVTRLFDIVKPAYAFFGEKDFQQVAIIKYFVKDLNYPLTIVPCSIIRESDGLAKSSRNTLLTPAQRAAAPHIYKTLCKAVELKGKYSPKEVAAILAKEIDENPELETEYIEIIDADTLRPVENWNDAENLRLWCAVYARPVRLIDNIGL
ncbi:MAG: pantoate--beta-alanine ligase [Bacteroidales bacterium]|nr:pantoate--beta-alanine ligase [Bacteroidales bacterium]MBQ3522575.1 pantoate--beta-alanine ligase [Bacteroidales bacterium]MBQ6871424.1 pantoate--beta-alanine ligase [Bacteroidales bacterium]MBQ7997724.1 pantoate--beta-alanine ligase [Bacteroidales bacterium]